MAFGTLGSTLNDELNRLANGGTYRDKSAMVDEALAAKQWANRENIIPYSTDTVGILNEIAALGPNKQNWYDFNGVCNYLAGTTGLPAAAALRQITTTGDILTSLASYYVDAATPTNWGSLGYVALPGVNSNYLSVPDETALDITGDIDIRVRVAMDDWTPAALNTLLGKYNASGSYSYLFGVQSTGVLSIIWSANGTATIQKDSTVATGLTDGTAKWVRVTLDVDNGASGNDVKFFTSDDGSTWTQLGTTVTTTSTTSIFSSTATVGIGATSTGTFTTAGKVYRAQILNGIGGTTVLDVNIASNFTSSSFNTFTATTGQTVTVNGVDTLANYGIAGSLLPTTVGSSLAADSNDAKFLDHTGTNYVYLPGVLVNNLSTPDATALDITGDIDLRIRVAMDDWTPGITSPLISKWKSGSDRSYTLRLNTDGALALIWSADGTTAITRTSTGTGITDGAVKWIRVTLDVDNGASGHDVKFYTSDDGATWTQLGTTITTAGTTSIYNSTQVLGIGQETDGTSITAGKIYRAQIFASLDGSDKRLDVDTSVITTGAATSFTAVTGQTVTINRSTSGRKTVAVTQPTWLFGTDDYMEVNNRYMAHSTAAENYVYLTNATGNYLSVTDNPPLDITSDLDIQVKVAMNDWTAADRRYLLSKYVVTGNQCSYNLRLEASGILQLVWSPDGNNANAIAKSSTVAPTVADGATLWVRATLDVDNGAGGNDVKFYTSTDGTTWTQLGSTITTAGVTSVYSGTAPVEIGSFWGGIVGATSSPLKFYRAIIKNGIDGTTVLDADASVITLPSQTTFVDRSSNAYTVTINKSGVGTFVSTGNYLYLPGIASNYASAPDAAALDITGDLDLRVKVALDDWTPSSAIRLLAKYGALANSSSYELYIDTTGVLVLRWSDGTTNFSSTSTVAPTVTDGATLWVRATLDVDNGASGNTTTFYTSTDGITWTQLGATVVSAGVTSIYNSTALLTIGAYYNGNNPLRGKFFRAQVLNGIGGTVAFDANFESSITSLNQTTFTESSTNGATVTINRSGSTYRSAGVIDAGYLYPGATNTFSASATDYLNFGATDSATLLVFTRQWNTPTNFGRTISKEGSTNTASGYLIQNYGTGLSYTATINSGTSTSAGVGTPTYTAGSATLVGFVLDRTAQTFVRYMNTTGTSVSATGVGSLSSISPLDIGRNALSGGGAIDMEFVGAAVFRQALTATQICQISNYFANREVYL